VTAYGNAVRDVFTAMDGTDTARPLRFTPNPEITVDTGGRSIRYPQLAGWLFGEDAGLLLNTGPDPMEIELTGPATPFQVHHRWTPTPLAPQTQTADLKTETYASEGTIRLPPWSLTRISTSLPSQ
jgi:hypothetical protein